MSALEKNIHIEGHSLQLYDAEAVADSLYSGYKGYNRYETVINTLKYEGEDMARLKVHLKAFIDHEDLMFKLEKYNSDRKERIDFIMGLYRILTI